MPFLRASVTMLPYTVKGALQISVKNLAEEVILDYRGGPIVIIMVFIGETKDDQSHRNRWEDGRRGQKEEKMLHRWL